QSRAAPATHDPPEQISPDVQAFPSSHAAALFVWTQPAAGSHESFVQPLPSLQFGAGPPTHDPPAHVSLVVQAFASSQAAALFVWTQPAAGPHESSVQPLLSLQFGGGPPTHAPPAQLSLVVQAFPSSHADVLFTWTQPVAGSHE